jgi:excisionase family DNA binding protein
MAKGKNVLTTGDVARICNVAPRTVSKWFDNGQLKGYRIPGSKDRRIPRSELTRFMREHNIPSAALGAGQIRVLIAGDNTSETSALAKVLITKGNYEVQTVQSNFETGMVAQKFSPHVLLINLLSKGLNATEICRSIRGDGELQTIKIIAIANKLSNSEATALLGKGFDGYITNPCDATEAISKIEEATAIIY